MRDHHALGVTLVGDDDPKTPRVTPASFPPALSTTIQTASITNWTLHSTTPHTPSQWPQSSDAPLSAQLALSALRASTPAPRAPLPTPAVKPTRTLSSRAPAGTPSSTYVDTSCTLCCKEKEILRIHSNPAYLPTTTAILPHTRSQTNDKQCDYSH